VADHFFAIVTPGIILPFTERLEMELYTCNSCGRESPASYDRCGHCGAHKPSARNRRKCPHCKEWTSAENDIVCPHCGKSLTDLTKEREEGKDTSHRNPA
jgi:hypothetical protein